MLLNPSKRLFSLFIVPLLVIMVGCGGDRGGTAVVIPEFDSGLVSDGSFEFGSDAWSGNAVNFQPEEGNETNTVNFADVAVAGNGFDVNLSQALNITQGKRYTFQFRAKTKLLAAARSSDVFAARTANTRTITAGIGLNEAPFSNTVEEVTLTTEWQTFTLTLDASGFGGANSRVLFDMGADTGVVILDDVILKLVGDIPAITDIPSTSFDDGLLVNGDFESGSAGWIGNAASVTDELLGFGGTLANFASVDVAGDAFNVNLSQVVAITMGETYTLTFMAKSDGNRSILAGIGLNEDPWTNKSQSVDLTTEWQTFTLTLPATDFGSANSRVLFDMGAETGQVIIDNVSLKKVGGGSPTDPTDPTDPVVPVVPVVPVAPPVAGCDTGTFNAGLLTNGDFEAGVSPWFGQAANVTDELLGCNGTKANFANILPPLPANAFDVNLSQIVAITEDATYTLTFKAKSDRNRTMIAGIGLNEGDFANNSKTVNLTPNWQTYTLTLPATGFGSANSRVLFDMGGALGVVIIDEVSLTAGGTTPVDPVDPVVSGVIFSGTFGGTTIDGNTYTYPTGAEAWGGFANEDTSLYPFAFANGGNIEFTASAPDGDVTLKFKFEKAAFPDVDPSFETAEVVISGSDQSYTVAIPVQASENTYSSLLLYLVTQDLPVTISDLVVNAETDPVDPVDPGSQVDLPVTFDDAALIYTTVDFGGNTSSLVADPSDASNMVVSTIKAADAQVWAGTTIEETVNGGFATAIPFTATATTMSVRVYSPDAGIPVRLKVERADDAGVTAETETMTIMANAWETLVFDLSDVVTGTAAFNAAAGYDKASIFFNFGTDGATAGEKTYLWDDVVFGGSVTPPSGGSQIDLPVNFDTAGVDYALTDFGGNASSLVADPSDASNMVVSTVKAADAQLWAGTTIGNSANAGADQGFATVIPFTASATTMSVRVYSPDPGVIVRLKVERSDDAGITAETEAMTTVAGDWETLVFDLNMIVSGTAAFNPAAGYDKASIFFNFGTDGATAGEKTYLWDDVIFGGSTTAAPVATAGALTVFADTAAAGWSPWQEGTASWAVVADDAAHGDVIEFGTGGQTVVGVSSRVDLGGNGTTHNASSISTGTLEFDIKMTVAPNTSIWKLKVEGTGAMEVDLTCVPVLDTWVHCSTPLNTLGNLSAINNVMIFPNWADNAGAVYRVDNLEFVAGAAPPTGSATLLNGNFENGLTSWTQTPDGNAGNPGTISLVTVAPGNRAGSVARLEAAGSASPGAQDVLLTQVVGAGTINAGDNINVSFDLYGSLAGDGGVVFAEIIYLDGDGNDNGRNFVGPAAPYTPTGTWTPHSGSKPAGQRADGSTASVAGGVMLLLKSSCGAIDGCGVDAYFDNVTLTVTP